MELDDNESKTPSKIGDRSTSDVVVRIMNQRCQAKLEVSREFVCIWVDTSANIVKVAEQSCPESELTGTKLKVLEVAARVLEAIGYETAVLPTLRRLQMVKTWLAYVRSMKCLIDSVASDDDNNLLIKFDGELWLCLESSFVSIILTLPSGNQTEILTEWLEKKPIRYPDLRSKVSERRLTWLDGNHQTTSRV